MPRSVLNTNLAVILVVLVAWYYWYHHRDGDVPQQSSKTLADIMDTAELEDQTLQSQNESSVNQRTIHMLGKIVELIKFLELENKSADEMIAEAKVNFSSINPKAIPTDEKMVAKIYLNVYLALLVGQGDLRKAILKLHPSDHLKYNLSKYNNGIVGLGVENFMTTATQFCEDATAGGSINIFSIGSGDGTIETDIVMEYRQRFDKDLRITLVDPDPKFSGIVDFKTVDDLIEDSPHVVGNCVVFIIWPNTVDRNVILTRQPKIDLQYYDVEAIRKLQPKAVLTVYENHGGSGSNDFRTFLHDESLDVSPEEFGATNWLGKLHFNKKKSYGLDNYRIHELARQKVKILMGTVILRMVKLVRID